MATADVTTTTSTLYREVRGSGPAVLFIAGATGDAGHFTRSAERLSDEFTVITYDRRGNSRSTAGCEGPRTATIAAQADDAAELLEACEVGQAVIFGTSGGAEIALEMLARRPDLMRGAVIHEPPLVAVLPRHDGPDPIEQILQQAQSDPRGALEAFIRLNSSDAAWDGLAPALRDRMLGNAGNLFGHELGAFISYAPDPEVLRAARVPVALLHSRDGLPFAGAVQAWLQSHIRVAGETISGHHAPYYDQPEVFAEEVRPILRRLWA